jgi:hypothetical protein
MLRPLVLLSLLMGMAAHAEDQPLRVYGYNASGASVYVTPVKALGAPSSDSEFGPGAFARKYLRGRLPVEVTLKPGQYLVSVVLPREQNMRDASLWAHELVWDGYDYHALVPQKSGGWRYAQCYMIEKKDGFPAEVLAVFTDQMPLDDVQSFDCGSRTTRFTGPEEDLEKVLEDAGIQLTFHDDIIQGVKAGMKVLLRSGDDRYAIQCDGTVSLSIFRAHGQGAWAGHRLNVVEYQ